MHWAFPEKYCNPPVVDINGKFQGLEQKLLEFQGDTLKIEEKT